jgi:hypothetical protein
MSARFARPITACTLALLLVLTGAAAFAADSGPTPPVLDKKLARHADRQPVRERHAQLRRGGHRAQ